jgi:hypothetical protein
MDNRTSEMTEEELWQEDVYDKLTRGIFTEYKGNIYDFDSGEFICEMKLIEPE